MRPISQRDHNAWLEVRARNSAWLAPWEATPPAGRDTADVHLTFRAMVRHLRSQARRGQMLPFVVTYDDRFAGQLTVGGIAWGSLCSAHLGYWLDSRLAGRGVMPTAVALATDHAFAAVGLHRVEVNIRPENSASLRVVEKLGFRDEGIRERLLHISGEWRDHRSFALTAEEVGEGLIARWQVARERPA